jgi:hypothetical protein
MEGKGAYNRYAKLPAGGAALALPLLEEAVRRLELDTNDQTVVIADYGSSQGKNSMVPMDIAIRGLRRRIGANRPISVFHIDQPSNDFNALFEVLDADPDRYVLDDPNVFPARLRVSRMVVLRRCVAQPSPGIDSRPLLSRLRHRPRAR